MSDFEFEDEMNKMYLCVRKWQVSPAPVGQSHGRMYHRHWEDRKIIIADILNWFFIYYFPECNEVLATFEVFVKSLSGRVADVCDGDGEALRPVRGLIRAVNGVSQKMVTSMTALPGWGRAARRWRSRSRSPRRRCRWSSPCSCTCRSSPPAAGWSGCQRRGLRVGCPL